MKKIISLFLLVSLLLPIVCVNAEMDNNNLPEFAYEKLGRGSWSSETHDGDICYDRYGNPLLCYGTQGGYFWVIDLKTGKVKEKFNVLGGAYTYGNIVETAPDGKVYMHFYPGNCFNVYDPISNTLSLINTEPSYRSDIGSCISADGKIYSGEYGVTEGAELYEYDIKTQKIRKFGPFDERVQYIKGIAVEGKYAYLALVGDNELTRVLKLDLETGEVVDEFLKGRGSIYAMWIINDKLVATYYQNTLIVNMETYEVEDNIRTNPTTRTSEIRPSPYDKNVFYHHWDGYLYSYNVKTKEHIKLFETDLDTVLPWAELPNGDFVMAIRTATMEKVGYYNPKTNELKVMEPDKLADSGPNVEDLTCTPEGVLYVGGYQSSMGAYNVNTEEFIFSLPKWRQNQSAGFLNGKVYLGVYTDSVTFRYDPEKPITDHYLSYNYNNQYQGYDANPSMVYDIEDDQDRHLIFDGYKNLILCGTMSAYEKSGGAFVIIEEEDGINPPKAEVYRNIIPDQSIMGLAVKDDLVYISSTVRNGNGLYAFPEGNPQIVVFDLNKREVVKRVTPDFSSIGAKDAKSIGDLSFGPDGLLWGAITDKKGIIFAMDPETLEIKKHISIKSDFDKDAMAKPTYMEWGASGLLYANPGWVVSVIDPETLEYKVINGSSSKVALDPYENVWTAAGTSIDFFEINQYDRLKRFLSVCEKLKKEDYTEEEWETLQSKINEAKTFTKDTDWDTIKYAIREIDGLKNKKPFIKPVNDIEIILDGEKMDFDFDKTGTVKIYNGVTYVPYRAFLEKLGFKVDWDHMTGKINAKKMCRTIAMKVNNNVFTFNSDTVTADVCPILLSGRQYIPLRVIAENLGYEVGWNEQENSVELISK